MKELMQNNSKVKKETVSLPSNVFQRRRSSVHLQDAEKDLDLRANTLIGMTKQQVQKLVNFDNEYFKRLSKSPTGQFTNPKLIANEVLQKSRGRELRQDSPKQTAYFVDTHNSNSDRTTVMELRRAYSNLTAGNRNGSQRNNIYQYAMQRSKTDIPEIYTDRKLNFPPLREKSADPLLRKRLKFGSLRSHNDAPPFEQLPPIQLKAVKDSKNKSEDILNDNRVKEMPEKTLETNEETGNDETEQAFEKLLVLRHGMAEGSHGYSGELKLHPNKAELDDLIERSKNPVLVSKFRPPLRRTKTVNDMGFVIASATPTTESFKELREPKSNFEIRKEYGKNLEKNWFKSFIQQAKAKKGDLNNSKFNLSLELFYSPEPKSSEGSVVSDVDSMCNENVDNSDDEMKKLCEIKPFVKKKHLLDMSGLFSSTDVLTGEDNELDRETPSEIEIVLKDNELIQRKTKHKMRRKRRKKEKRCKAMTAPEPGSEDVPLPTLSDKELRALRLNIKKKRPVPVLTGKRKFLQAANAVFVAVQFRKILANVRERKRRSKIRKMKKKMRRVKWKPPVDEYAEFERSTTPPTLKEKFLKEIGNDLLDDIDKLNFDSPENIENITAIDEGICGNKPLSKFGIEASKACLEDVERLLTDKNRTLQKFSRLRRHSAPLLSMPEGFLIEMSDKPKSRRRDRSKSVRRIKSAKKKSEKRPKSPNLVPKCSCSHNKVAVDRKLSTGHSSRVQSIACTHKEEADTPKVKYFVFHRSQVLKRRRSLNEQELKESKEIDLFDLLRDVDIPAKEIRIQIIRRKMKKQKRRKEEALNVVICPPEESDNSEEESESSSDPETDESSSDDDEYTTNYVSPFVSSGVAWNQQKVKRPTWTAADVDRELKRVTRFFLEMKDCSYIRWTGMNQAIISKLDEIMT